MANPKDNCWTCDHFQRYERGENPQSCVGECRFNPPGSFLSGDRGDGTLINFIRTWPVYENSFWRRCRRYERTREKNLPPAPPNNGTNCSQQAVFPDNVNSFWSAPWNKKIMPGYTDDPKAGISCYNCDHFQLYDPDFSLIVGDCQAIPVQEYSMIFIYTMPMQYGYLTAFPFTLPSSPCAFCDQWERARHILPEIDFENICPEMVGLKKLNEGKNPFLVLQNSIKEWKNKN